MQRVFQIGAIKKILQEKNSNVKVTAKILKKHFDANLEVKSGEAATEHYITTAMALWTAVFSVKKLKVLRLQFSHSSVFFLSIVHIDIDVIDIDDLEELAFLADETFGKRGPLDSVLKLEMLMRACKSSTWSIEFALLCMCDSCLNRTVVPSEMTPNWLFGKGSQKG